MKLPIQVKATMSPSLLGQKVLTGIMPSLPIAFGSGNKCTCIAIGGGTPTCYKRGSDTEKRQCAVGETTKQCCDKLYKGEPGPFPFSQMFFNSRYF